MDMNTNHADKIADLCEMDGVDSVFYGIFELFPNGKTSCAGIVQHFCTAEMQKRILEHQYEYCELIGVEVIIRPISSEDTKSLTKIILNTLIEYLT